MIRSVSEGEPEQTVPNSRILYTGDRWSGKTKAKSNNVPLLRDSGLTCLTRDASSLRVASNL